MLAAGQFEGLLKVKEKLVSQLVNVHVKSVIGRNPEVVGSGIFIQAESLQIMADCLKAVIIHYCCK